MPPSVGRGSRHIDTAETRVPPQRRATGPPHLSATEPLRAAAAVHRVRDPTKLVHPAVSLPAEHRQGRPHAGRPAHQTRPRVDSARRGRTSELSRSAYVSIFFEVNKGQ